MGRLFKEVDVECYAGHRGQETPRAVVLDGKRFEVRSILSRKRVFDPADGSRREVWRCRLDDGRAVTATLLENGTWRVSQES
jgi:hypothetical protein